MTAPLLQMRQVSKTFPGVKALDRVDLTLRRGEIHALMGENGAGKSTLIKVLTGVYPRDSGAIELDGQPIGPRTPQEAEAAGLSTVYQEVNLIPNLSIAENILLGRQPTRFGCVDWAAIRRRATQALRRLGLEVDVRRELASCSMAVQQMVAIARALDVQARLLILDEPTSSLDAQEVAGLFRVLRRLRDEGLGLLFVTHFLNQVYEVADRITVLRNGALVGEYETATLPRLELIGRMLGKDTAEVQTLSAPAPLEATEGPRPFLEARGLARRGGIAPLDLEVREGEVLGLAGLLGSGRTETARVLFGIDPPDAGEIRVAGKPAVVRSPAEAVRHRFAFCSEDRKLEGIIPHLSVRENIILAMQASRGPWRLLSRREQEGLAAHYIRALDIRTPGPETPLLNLSGGNQQKVLLARWLALQPRLFILDEPTRGIDVGAKAEIEKLVHALRARGVAIVFISSELEEVVRNSQRVVVLRDRAKVGELAGADVTEPRILDRIAHHEP